MPPRCCLTFWNVLERNKKNDGVDLQAACTSCQGAKRIHRALRRTCLYRRHWYLNEGRDGWNWTGGQKSSKIYKISGFWIVFEGCSFLVFFSGFQLIKGTYFIFSKGFSDVHEVAKWMFQKWLVSQIPKVGMVTDPPWSLLFFFKASFFLNQILVAGLSLSNDAFMTGDCWPEGQGGLSKLRFSWQLVSWQIQLLVRFPKLHASDFSPRPRAFWRVREDLQLFEKNQVSSREDGFLRSCFLFFLYIRLFQQMQRWGSFGISSQGFHVAYCAPHHFSLDILRVFARLDGFQRNGAPVALPGELLSGSFVGRNKARVIFSLVGLKHQKGVSCFFQRKHTE